VNAVTRPSVAVLPARRLAAAAAALAALLAVTVGSRSAQATGAVTVDCSQLQGALTAATSGEVITLDQLCSGATFTLPTVAITLQGQPGTNAGFDGTGTSGSASLLSGTVNDTATLTISDLAFENAQGGASLQDGAGLFLEDTGPGGVTLSGDSFTNDRLDAAANVFGGGMLLADLYSGAGAPSPFAIANTTFNNDIAEGTGTTAQARGGGAYVTVHQSGGSAAPRPLVLSGDTFRADTASAGVTGTSAFNVGGGIAAYADGSGVFPLTQNNDIFDGDGVTGTGVPPSSNYGGGGEWAQGFNVTSTDDTFTGDAISGTSGAGAWSWGGGLGILNSGCQTGVNAAYQTASSATNLIAAGDSINGGNAADDGGAGIYVGCDSVQPGNNLTLYDSTVTANTSPGGSAAGIDGEAVDHLTLDNTIDTANAGGSDLAGFGLGGGSGTLTAAYSDTCLGSSAPPGAGDICAAPALVGGVNVRESAASPTIDAGLNSLVPAGLTTDALGAPRVDPGGKATVDIGAAEYVHPPPTATTAAASAVAGDQATLTGSVDPLGTPASYSFEYGTTAAYGQTTPASSAGSGGAAVAASAVVGALQPATAYDFRIIATSPAGTATGANMAFITAAAAVTKLRESNSRWRAGTAIAPARHGRAADGTTFSFTLNVTGAVRFTFTHRVGGRRSGKRCVAKTKRNVAHARCERTATVGSLAADDGPGPNDRVFDGILDGHRLRPGRYTAHLRVTAASGGAASKPATIAFTIVKP